MVKVEVLAGLSTVFPGVLVGTWIGQGSELTRDGGSIAGGGLTFSITVPTPAEPWSYLEREHEALEKRSCS